MEDLDQEGKLPDDVALAARSQDKLFGQYVLVREIGRGGVGIVYYGYDLRLRRRVAIKLLLDMNPDHFIRFEREARAAARLEHPGIVRVIDLARVGNRPYIAMEFVDGKTLQELFREGSLGIGKLCTVIRDVARALGQAHAAGIVHRDIKPGNIIVEADGRGRVMDFGVARDVQSAGARLTATGATLGTPKYMSPEQVTDARVAGPPADVYSLGAVLYEGLTGRPPFVGSSPVDVMFRIMKGEVEKPSTHNPEVSRRLDALVLRCLARDPLERYPNGKELADDLERWLTGQESSFIRPPTKESDPGKKSKETGEIKQNKNGEVGAESALLARAATRIDETDTASTGSNPFGRPLPAGMRPPRSRAPLVFGVALVGLALGVGGGLFYRSAEQARREEAAKDHLARAESFLKKGRFQDAEAAIASALALVPDDDAAHRLELEAKEGLRKEEAARADKTRHGTKEALLARSRAEKNLEKKLALLDEAVKLEPDDRSTLLLRVRVRIRIYQGLEAGSGEPRADEQLLRAAEELDHILAAQPSCTEAILQRARVGAWTAHVQIDREQVKLAASGKDSWAAYARMLDECFENRQAISPQREIELMTPVVEKDPSFGYGWLDLASAYESLGDYARSGEAATRAIDLDAGAYGREARAKSRFVSHDLKGCQEDCAAWLAERPWATLAHEILARCALAERDHKRALEEGDRLVALKAVLQGWAVRAEANLALGKNAEAILDLNAALARPELAARDPQKPATMPIFGYSVDARPRVFLLRARARQAAGDLDGAVDDARSGLLSHPADARVQEELTLLALRLMREAQGDIAMARGSLDDLLRSRGTLTPALLVELASAELAVGDLVRAGIALDEARKSGELDERGKAVAADLERARAVFAKRLEPFDAAVLASPGDANALVARADFLRQGGEMKRARADCDAAIGASSGRAKARAYHERVLIAERTLPELLADVDLALEADPTFVLALADRARLKVAKNDLAGAREDAERAARADPPDPRVLASAAAAFEMLKEPATALELADRALGLEASCPEALRERARLREQRGDLALAAADLRAIAALDPPPADAADLVRRAAWLDRRKR